MYVTFLKFSDVLLGSPQELEEKRSKATDSIAAIIGTGVLSMSATNLREGTFLQFCFRSTIVSDHPMLRILAFTGRERTGISENSWAQIWAADTPPGAWQALSMLQVLCGPQVSRLDLTDEWWMNPVESSGPWDIHGPTNQNSWHVETHVLNLWWDVTGCNWPFWISLGHLSM